MALIGAQVLQVGKAAIELNPESRVQTEKHLDSIKGGGGL
jgi:hypothetical protein